MLLAGVFFAASFGLIAVLFAITQKRSKALAAWASAHGWQYDARDLQYINLLWGYPFGEGSSRAARDVLTGTAHGYRAVCFSYQFQTGSANMGGSATNGSSTQYFTVWSLHMPTSLPRLRVARGLVGPMLHPSTEPVVQTGDAVFDLKFKVFTEDPDFARRLLDPQLRQMLLESDAPGFVIAGSDIGIASDGGTSADGVLPTFDYLARLITYLQKTELPAG